MTNHKRLKGDCRCTSAKNCSFPPGYHPEVLASMKRSFIFPVELLDRAQKHWRRSSESFKMMTSLT